MLRILKQAILRRPLTNSFPEKIAEPPNGFRGRPSIDFPSLSACEKIADACPTGAIFLQPAGDEPDEEIFGIDYGKCIFCGECEAACPESVRLTKDFQLAGRSKQSLVTSARYVRNPDGSWEFKALSTGASEVGDTVDVVGARLLASIMKHYGRSLHIREVDAGSCNGCEVEITGLSNPMYDVERFGVHFVASPRHADMLLVTGPVTRNLEIALKQTYEATPGPKLVVAVGACAIGGGIFGKSYASWGGVDSVVPVDVYVPGCPPRPEALLQGILMAVERDPLAERRTK